MNITQAGTILLIDHDPNNGIILEEVIREFFPNTILLTQTKVKNGIELANTENPDLIFLNFLSPGNDGFEACHRLKLDKRTGNIPVVCITRRDDDSNRKIEALDAGAEAFQYLPLDKIELLVQIRAMLKIKSSIVLEKSKFLTEETEKNEEKYRRIFENIQDVYYEVSIDGIIIEISPSIESISDGQYSRGDLIGRPIADLYANIEDRNAFLSQLYLSGRVNDYELSILNKDGTIIPCTISAKLFFDASGTLEKVVGSLHNITRRKEIEDQLRESEEQFKNFFERAADAIFIADMDSGIILDANKAASSMLMLPHEKIVGLHQSQLHPSHIEKLSKESFSVHQDLAKQNVSLTPIETSVICSDGTEVSVEVLASFVSIKGKPCLMGIFRNINERKLAEKQLQVSQNKVTEILESVTDGFVAFDAQMNYTYLNNRGAELLNQNPSDLIGKNYWTEFPEAKGTPFANSYLLALETRKTVVFEDYYEPWDRWFENRIYPTHEGIAVYFSETTERKRIERSLAESNELNKNLLRTIPFGMDIVDEDGNILFLSENLEKLFGKEALGQKCWSLYRDDCSQCSDCPLLTGIKVGETNPNETSGVMGGKSYQISHTGMIYQGKKAMLEIFQDITQKKKTEKKVKLLAQSLESISECVTITDLHDTIIYINESVLHTYQYTKEEIIGKHISILRTPEQKLELARTILPKTMEGGWRGEIYNVKKDGTVFPILLSTSVIKDENDHPVSLIGVAMDITEMIRNREELVAAKEKAEEINRLKSAFLGNMSHEIRTPMNAIIGFSDLMAEADEDEKSSYAEIILNSSTQLLTLIDDVILISRLQSEKIPVHFTEFNPAELITDIYRMFSHPDMNKGLEIKAVLPEEYKDLIIRSDANKVRQILTNLTSNAVKYTFEGSVRIGFELHKDQIEFFVKDTGIGVPEKERLHIFETFYRGEQALSCAIRGTGLGLNIAKELVGVIGGTIGVDSVVDNGSRFYFTLPIKEVKLKNQERHSHLTKFKKLADFTILITDDEPINSKYLEAILKGIFKKIDHARNGKEAVEMVSQNNYNLILMDLKMPVMGGIEATRIIREQFPDIPIIAQTAYSLPEERDVALAAGCNEFISKPIKKEALMEIINKYISDFK